MIVLEPSEELLLVMRRHWYVLAGQFTLFIALLLLPSLALIAARRFAPAIFGQPLAPYLYFFLALYLAGLILYALIIWTAYYLDSWIITSRRIIDIEQYGLFHREVKEINLDRVQNVTVEIPGFVPTLLGFGDIRVETAGQGVLLIKTVPHLEEAKTLILKYSQFQRGQRSY